MHDVVLIQSIDGGLFHIGRVQYSWEISSECIKVIPLHLLDEVISIELDKRCLEELSDMVKLWIEHECIDKLDGSCLIIAHVSIG